MHRYANPVVVVNEETMRQLAESRAAVEAGDVLDGDELAALMAKRSRKARCPVRPPTATNSR